MICAFTGFQAINRSRFTQNLVKVQLLTLAKKAFTCMEEDQGNTLRSWINITMVF